MPDEAKNESADPLSEGGHQQRPRGYRSVVIPVHEINLFVMESGEIEFLLDERHPKGREDLRPTERVILRSGQANIGVGLHALASISTHPPQEREDTMSPEEAAMSAEIDRIMARLEEGIPKLHKKMDDIRVRLRRPIAL